MPFEVVQDLKAAVRDFVGFYNYRRYHKALGDVTPMDVLEGGGRRSWLGARRFNGRRSSDGGSTIRQSETPPSEWPHRPESSVQKCLTFADTQQAGRETVTKAVASGPCWGEYGDVLSGARRREGLDDPFDDTRRRRFDVVTIWLPDSNRRRDAALPLTWCKAGRLA